MQSRVHDLIINVATRSDLNLANIFLLVLSCIGRIFNSFVAKADFCCPLICFANSLDPDQDPQNVGPGLDPNCSVRASAASLCCVLEQGTFILA